MAARSWGKRADVIVHEHEPFNAEPPPAVLAQADLTGNDAFYVRNHGPVPRLDPQAWRLSVDGLVQRPLELSLEQLRGQFPAHEVVATMQCAGNRRSGLMKLGDIPGHPWGPGATSTARWEGVRLADVLRAAGIGSGAVHVAFEAPDVAPEAAPPQRFGASIPLAKATTDDVLLAWAMNGRALPAVHGAPVRVVVPGYIGARSVKWVERISVRRAPSENYFQAVAYRLLPPGADPGSAPPGEGVQLGPLAVNAAILHPADGETIPAGPATVTGYALGADDRGVARVDVSADGGRTWAQAELGEAANPWTWRRWRAVLDLPRGEVEVVARAWDTAGTVQPERELPLWNPKGYFNTAWSRIGLTAR